MILRDGREHLLYAYGSDNSAQSFPLLTNCPLKVTLAQGGSVIPPPPTGQDAPDSEFPAALGGIDGVSPHGVVGGWAAEGASNRMARRIDPGRSRGEMFDAPEGLTDVAIRYAAQFAVFTTVEMWSNSVSAELGPAYQEENFDCEASVEAYRARYESLRASERN